MNMYYLFIQNLISIYISLSILLNKYFFRIIFQFLITFISYKLIINIFIIN